MTKTSFINCLAIINPHSTRSEQALVQVEELKAYFSKDRFTSYELTKDDLKNPRALQAAIGKLTKRDLLIIVGGDGTISMIVNLVLTHTVAACRGVTMLPLEAGNASDIAHMVHGKRISDTAWIMEHGVRRPAYTISVDITSKQESSHTHALAYASFGAIGYTAEHIDSIGRDDNFINNYRPLVLLQEAISGYIALLRAKRFKATLNNSRTQNYYDIVYVNGSRMAKLYRLHTKLHEPKFARLIVRHKHPELITHLFTLGTGYAYRKKTTAHQYIELHQSVLSQIDGEVRRLAPGTRVKIQQETQPYYVLSCVSM